MQALVEHLAASGLILVSKGTTADAAEAILTRAVDAGLAEIPETVEVPIPGLSNPVDLPVAMLLTLARPWIEAGISELIVALSPQTTEVIVSDDVEVSWDIT